MLKLVFKKWKVSFFHITPLGIYSNYKSERDKKILPNFKATMED